MVRSGTVSSARRQMVSGERSWEGREDGQRRRYLDVYDYAAQVCRGQMWQ